MLIGAKLYRGRLQQAAPRVVEGLFAAIWLGWLTWLAVTQAASGNGPHITLAQAGKVIGLLMVILGTQYVIGLGGAQRAPKAQKQAKPKTEMTVVHDFDALDVWAPKQWQEQRSTVYRIIDRRDIIAWKRTGIEALGFIVAIAGMAMTTDGHSLRMLVSALLTIAYVVCFNRRLNRYQGEPQTCGTTSELRQAIAAMKAAS